VLVVLEVLAELEMLDELKESIREDDVANELAEASAEGVLVEEAVPITGLVVGVKATFLF